MSSNSESNTADSSRVWAYADWVRTTTRETGNLDGRFSSKDEHHRVMALMTTGRILYRQRNYVPVNKHRVTALSILGSDIYAGFESGRVSKFAASTLNQVKTNSEITDQIAHLVPNFINEYILVATEDWIHVMNCQLYTVFAKYLPDRMKSHLRWYNKRLITTYTGACYELQNPMPSRFRLKTIKYLRSDMVHHEMISNYTPQRALDVFLIRHVLADGIRFAHMIIDPLSAPRKYAIKVYNKDEIIFCTKEECFSQCFKDKLFIASSDRIKFESELRVYKIDLASTTSHVNIDIGMCSIQEMKIINSLVIILTGQRRFKLYSAETLALLKTIILKEQPTCFSMINDNLVYGTSKGNVVSFLAMGPMTCCVHCDEDFVHIKREQMVCEHFVPRPPIRFH